MNYSNKKITKNKPLFICITPLKLHMGYKLIFFYQGKLVFRRNNRCLLCVNSTPGFKNDTNLNSTNLLSVVFAICESACNYLRNSKNEADRLAIVVTYQGTYRHLNAVLQSSEILI
jgi:hypothetical protein